MNTWCVAEGWCAMSSPLKCRKLMRRSCATVIFRWLTVCALPFSNWPLTMHWELAGTVMEVDEPRVWTAL